MCQIIHKPKGYVLRDDLLYSTCKVNGDGFGYMFFDESAGHIVADKAFAGANTPEAVGEVMETLRDKEVFFHLRFRTMGKVDEDSCHPFKVFDNGERQVYLMHNGTLYGFGSKDEVDSLAFGLEVVAPLYERTLASGITSPLTDPLFQKIMTEFVGTGSKVVLMDNTGTVSIVNAKGGVDYQDKESGVTFWVSNTYSFDRYHREPKEKAKSTFTYPNGTGGNTKYYGAGAWNSYLDQCNDKEPTIIEGESTVKGTSVIPFDPTAGKAVVTTTPVTPVSTTVDTPVTLSDLPLLKSFEIQTVPTVMGTPPWERETYTKTKLPERVSRKSYIFDILKLFDIEGIFDLEYSDYVDIIDDDPEGAALLINDLVKCIYEERYEGSF